MLKVKWNIWGKFFFTFTMFGTSLFTRDTISSLSFLYYEIKDQNILFFLN